MLAPWLTFLIAVTDSLPPAASDSLAAPPRIVTRMQELVVRGARLHDPLSSQTVHVIPSTLARALPVDRAAELIGLQAGVVARGEALHVRGGRAGETRSLLQGITLEEPLRGRALELPLTAVREVELASGGLDADLGGALAGVITYRTHEPGERQAELVWKTDATKGFDLVAGRAGGPIGGTGIGAVVSAEATLDDTHLPTLRTDPRRRVLGGSFGWRADNRLLGHAKLSTLGASRLALEVVANRRVTRPFDPMWSLDGWTIPCDDPDCAEGPVYSPTALPGYTRYRAADHLAITDTRGLASVLAYTHPRGPWLFRGAAGWTALRAITSLDGRDDEAYLIPERFPEFGLADSPKSEPFYVYRGDEPFFRRRHGDRWEARADAQRTSRAGHLLKLGGGLTYEHAALRELDLTVTGLRTDSLRSYAAWAPGGFAYAHGRWAFEGLVANGGLRLEAFTAGPQASRQSYGRDAATTWSLSPRLGVAYPVSVRSVFSLSYSRVTQNPDRDFLYDDREQTTNRQPIGQPTLVPATVISYQAALKHVFDPQWSVQAAVFYRDLWDLVGARNHQPLLQVAQLRYESAENGSASGFELSLRNAGARGFAELHYTYLDARGTISGEEGVPFGPRQLRRPESIGAHPLDWDRRHSIAFVAHREWPHWGSLSWTTFVGSGLPWTPRERRQLEADLSNENSERFGWEEHTSLAARAHLPWAPRRVTVGLEVRNLFDWRGEIAATTDGYPHPLINTYFDDYGAFRTETGRPGGAYWDDRNGDGSPGWKPVHDPRLFAAPRAVRLTVNARW